jgi:PRTRC genetic system protein E
MFQELDNLISDGQSLNFVITKKGDSLTVSVLPQANNLKDEAKNKISPLVLSGAPEDLDNEFVSSISEPLKKASGLLLNMETFEKQLSESQKSSKAAEQANKAEKEKKEKISKIITKAQGLEKDGKKKEALAEYEKALAVDDTNAKIKQKVAQLKSVLSQGDMFGANPEETPAEEIDFSEETSVDENDENEDENETEEEE